MRGAIVGLGLCVGLAGCAGAQKVPTEQLVDSQVTIRQAEAAGAEQVPEAARHLQLAREQAQEARALLEANRRQEAALYLQRAEADAELALALALEAPARTEAQRALDEVRGLQQDAARQ